MLTVGSDLMRINGMQWEDDILIACLVVDLVRYASARCPR
jgi:hypothetical protein